MSKAILRDNDSKFLELVILSVKTIDPKAIVNITSILHTHQVDIQVKDHKIVFQEIKRLHSLYGLDFKATEFIKNRDTIISFTLSDL
jgi:hypothetical protein